MEAIPSCSLQNKLHLFSLTQYGFILIQIVPLHACYMFRPVLRPFSGMSTQNLIKENTVKSKGPSGTCLYESFVLTCLRMA
jgi:hypothetical protein